MAATPTVILVWASAGAPSMVAIIESASKGTNQNLPAIFHLRQAGTTLGTKHKQLTHMRNTVKPSNHFVFEIGGVKYRRFSVIGKLNVTPAHAFRALDISFSAHTL